MCSINLLILVIVRRQESSMEEMTLIEYINSDEFIKASSNSTRLVGKLKTAIQHEQLYETHQILRTIYFRFSNNKEKLNALENLLYHGAYYLLLKNEFTSGQDIATLFLELAAKCLSNKNKEDENNTQYELIISEKVANIAVKLPDTEIGQSRFLFETLKILIPKLLDRNLLHNILANKFWQHKDFVNGRYHYLRCASLENAENIAQLLIEYQTLSATKSEIDLFITQFILQLLCLQSPLDPPTKQSNEKQKPDTNIGNKVIRKTRKTIKIITEKIFMFYTLNHPLLNQSCIPYSNYPLLNFTYFIISILDSTYDESSTFKTLCDIYRITWSRDPNYSDYLNRIGTIYFGVVDQAKQRQGGGGGILNNILLSLLEEDENSNQENYNLSSSDELD